MSHNLSILLLLVIFCGCTPGNPVTVYGTSQRTTSFTHITEENVPGLDRGSVAVVTMQAGPPAGVPFVVWSDMTGWNGHGGGSAAGAFYDAEYRTDDSRKVDAFAETSDGVTGTVTIDGTTYNIGAGALFLVSTQSGGTRVLQIDYDVTDFPIDRDELASIADENPEIGEFFRSAVDSAADSGSPESGVSPVNAPEHQ